MFTIVTNLVNENLFPSLFTFLQKDRTIFFKEKNTYNEEKKNLDLYHHVLAHVQMALLIL
jgi:hypothetical protein